MNQAYAVGLDGFEIGDGPLVLSPDGKYFYLYFPDWIANGTLHTINASWRLNHYRRLGRPRACCLRARGGVRIIAPARCPLREVL